MRYAQQTRMSTSRLAAWLSTEQFDGTVTDKMTKLVTAKESVSGARVAYDNGSDVWHFDGDAVTVWRLSAAAAPTAFE